MPTITLSSASPAGLKSDAIVIAIAKGANAPELLPGTEAVDEVLGGTLATTLAALGATGKADEITRFPTLGATTPPVVIAVGIGALPEDSGPKRHEAIRRGAGAAARALAGTSSAVVSLPVDGPQDAAAIADGLHLGAYSYDEYKTNGSPNPPLATVTIVGPGVKTKAVREAVTRAETIAAAVNTARDWVNMPPRDLTPETFAESATKYLKGRKIKIEVLDEKALAKGGYGGIMGVGQGSQNPPRLVRIEYRPTKAVKHVVLVGKGITFDTGGLSLKTTDQMVTMKSDMSGAAAVVAAIAAVADLSPNVAVTAYAALAENMPSGAAQRPSDVITIYGGKTVEVLNTDAEGRLVMADPLARSAEDQPDLVVDVATLTGSAVVALGPRVSAIMTNDDELRGQIYDAAERVGEAMWPLPLPSELREKLDSPVADIANIGDRWGGALQAGLFLEEFIPDDTKWAHLDIAGPAFNAETPYGYTPKGGTGAAVRALVQIIEDTADNPT